ncbi:diguanylate cyclase domain-containing protein [Vibrio tapetis]|nr:diguanylate cyclase [Vibrio tapetis]
METIYHWLWQTTREFGFECAVIILSIIMVFYYRHRAQRQAERFLSDVPMAVIVIDAKSGQLLNANRHAQQLFSIRKVGEQFLFPSMISPDFLLKIFSPFCSNGQFSDHVQSFPVSEHLSRKLCLSGQLEKYRGHSAWYVYAELEQSSHDDEPMLQQEVTTRVLDSMSELVFFKDKNHQLLGTNKAHDHFWHERLEEAEHLALNHKNGRFSQRKWTTTPDGKSCLLETHISVLMDDKGNPMGTLGISHDVTDWKKTQQALRDEMERHKDTEVALAQRDTILQSILTASPDPIGMFNENMIYEACNQPFVEALGITDPAELLGKKLDQVVPQDNYLNYENSDQQVMKQGKTLRYISKVERTSGVATWYDVVKSPYQDPASGTNGVLVITRDVSERYLAEQKLASANLELEKLSFIDGLTKVANRRRFDEQLDILWRLHVRQQKPLTIMLCDIDYFKDYNDSYGHQKGDDALIQVAQVFAQVLSRQSDFVARYGGEEFAFLLPDTDSEGAGNVAVRIHEAIQELRIDHEQSLVSDWVTLSIGIVSYIPNNDQTASSLVAMADKALYRAKQKGRNQSQFY